jgi:hypothetical protein
MTRIAAILAFLLSLCATANASVHAGVISDGTLGLIAAVLIVGTVVVVCRVRRCDSCRLGREDEG